ncbi:hypothetical protein QBC40DRAFT_46191 [Triangularia verruculosa]|uniref:Uncharacterized protein n=1 Tax=Triangularia verruculosa TaxID=2587418 RepID=A0AAN6XK98_9PEZI|nr:hypothetical protein QBC40DRAFT_46191 [Triangularia verruculosa]
MDETHPDDYRRYLLRVANGVHPIEPRPPPVYDRSAPAAFFQVVSLVKMPSTTQHSPDRSISILPILLVTHLTRSYYIMNKPSLCKHRVPPKFMGWMADKRPEALAVLGCLCVPLHHARDMWQVANAGVDLFGLIYDYLPG